MKQLEYPQKSKWRIIFVPQAKPPNNGFKNILEMFNKISGMIWPRLYKFNDVQENMLWWCSLGKSQRLKNIKGEK